MPPERSSLALRNPGQSGSSPVRDEQQPSSSDVGKFNALSQLRGIKRQISLDDQKKLQLSVLVKLATDVTRMPRVIQETVFMSPQMENLRQDPFEALVDGSAKRFLAPSLTLLNSASTATRQCTIITNQINALIEPAAGKKAFSVSDYEELERKSFINCLESGEVHDMVTISCGLQELTAENVQTWKPKYEKLQRFTQKLSECASINFYRVAMLKHGIQEEILSRNVYTPENAWDRIRQNLILSQKLIDEDVKLRENPTQENYEKFCQAVDIILGIGVAQENPTIIGESLYRKTLGILEITKFSAMEWPEESAASTTSIKSTQPAKKLDMLQPVSRKLSKATSPGASGEVLGNEEAETQQMLDLNVAGTDWPGMGAFPGALADGAIRLAKLPRDLDAQVKAQEAGSDFQKREAITNRLSGSSLAAIDVKIEKTAISPGGQIDTFVRKRHADHDEYFIVETSGSAGTGKKGDRSKRKQFDKYHSNEDFRKQTIKALQKKFGSDREIRLSTRVVLTDDRYKNQDDIEHFKKNDAEICFTPDDYLKFLHELRKA